MKFALTIFAIITGSLSLLASIGQLLVKDRRFENYNLCALFISLAFLQGESALIISGVLFKHPVLCFPHVTSMYLLGVILYFAYFLVSLRSDTLPEKKYLFFVPSFLAFAFDLYFLSLPETDKEVLLKGLLLGVATESAKYFKIALFGAGIQATAYMVFLMVKIRRSLKAGKTVILPRTTMVYTVLSLITMDIVIAGYVLSSLNLIISASVILGLLIIGAFLISQRYPEFLQIIIIPGAKNRYSRSRLTGVDIEELYRRFMYLIDTEKIYTDENVTLMDCADELAVTPHQLSEFLNEKLNSTFYSFINQHRINEAVRLLVDEPESTILSIAHIVGFNSKSSFYDSFSRFIGMTPVQYRNKLLKKE